MNAIPLKMQVICICFGVSWYNATAIKKKKVSIENNVYIHVHYWNIDNTQTKIFYCSKLKKKYY